MRIDRRYHLEDCVSKDQNQPAMRCIRLEADKAIATDGMVLAVVPIVREEEDSAVELSPSLLKDARKVKLPKNEETGEVVLGSLNGSATLKNGAVLPNVVSNEQFPNWGSVIPEETRPIKMQIAFDVAKLVRLASALGTDEVVFTMNENIQAIIVTPRKEEEQGPKGLLMPIRLIA